MKDELTDLTVTNWDLYQYLYSVSVIVGIKFDVVVGAVIIVFFHTVI